MFRKSLLMMFVAAMTAGIVVAQTATASPSVERGYLGVQTVDIGNENFAKYGLREVRGVAVEKVMDKSPAATAGLKVNDVIFRFDGEEIKSVRKLIRMISETAPEHKVRITILRDGNEQEMSVTLGKRQAIQMPPRAFAVPRIPEMPMLPDVPSVYNFPNGGDGRVFSWRVGGGRQIGVVVEVLTKQLAAHFNVDSGLLVSEVRESSPAAKAGLKAGDIIVEADGKAVKSDFDLINAISEKNEGDVSITYVRSGNRQTVNVTPETAKDTGVFSRRIREDSN